jgi:DNA-binding response OmpR family regulator
MHLSGAKLLIVDSDPSWRELLRDFFQMNSFQVTLAGSGIDALRALSLNPDLILLDLALPEMNGVALIREIHRMTPENTPPILICGDGKLPSDLAPLVRFHTPKPASLELLLSEVSRALASPK